MMRAAYAVETAASVMAGRIRWAQRREPPRSTPGYRQVERAVRPLLQPDAEEVLEQQAEPEHRQRDEDRRR